MTGWRASGSSPGSAAGVRSIASSTVRRNSAVQLLPRRGPRGLGAEQAEQQVDAVQVDQPRREARQQPLPRPIGKIAQRRGQRPPVGVDEALVALARHLPEAVGERQRAREVLQVPRQQAAVVGRQGRVDGQQRRDAVEVEARAGRAQPGEGAEDVLLPAGDVERGQLPQPVGGRTGRMQRIRVARLRPRGESEHGTRQGVRPRRGGHGRRARHGPDCRSMLYPTRAARENGRPGRRARPRGPGARERAGAVAGR